MCISVQGSAFRLNMRQAYIQVYLCAPPAGYIPEGEEHHPCLSCRNTAEAHLTRHREGVMALLPSLCCCNTDRRVAVAGSL